MKTTLNKIRAKSPCKSSWTKLLKNLGKTIADDEPLAITTILESNGLDDALWCLRAVDGNQRKMRLFAVECARSVQHLMTDLRSIVAIDVAERHANGLATNDELYAARAAARAAADSASMDAADSARAAARAAADSAWAAADSVKSAAWDAADSAWAVAGDVQANLLILVCEGAFDE